MKTGRIIKDTRACNRDHQCRRPGWKCPEVPCLKEVVYWRVVDRQNLDYLPTPVQTEEEAKARAAELGVRLVYLGHMFWNELRWIRQRTGLSIEYLARQANVSVIAWQNAEAGRSETVPAQIEWCALDWAEKMSIPPYGTPEPVVTPAHLRAIRAKMKLSKSGLADRLNISSSALYQWESGGRKIPPYVLYALRKLNQAEGQKGEE